MLVKLREVMMLLGIDWPDAAEVLGMTNSLKLRRLGLAPTSRIMPRTTPSTRTV